MSRESINKPNLSKHESRKNHHRILIIINLIGLAATIAMVLFIFWQVIFLPGFNAPGNDVGVLEVAIIFLPIILFWFILSFFDLIRAFQYLRHGNRTRKGNAISYAVVSLALIFIIWVLGTIAQFTLSNFPIPVPRWIALMYINNCQVQTIMRGYKQGNTLIYLYNNGFPSMIPIRDQDYNAIRDAAQTSHDHCVSFPLML